MQANLGFLLLKLAPLIPILLYLRLVYAIPLILFLILTYRYVIALFLGLKVMSMPDYVCHIVGLNTSANFMSAIIYDLLKKAIY